MKTISLAVTLLVLLLCAGSAAAIGPGPVHQCGTFVSYRPPSATQSGELVIGSTTYAAAWMGSTGPAGSTLHTFRQVIASGVTAGSQACLDGTIALSQTEANLLTDFTVSPAAPNSLPSTSSQSPTDTAMWSVVWLVLALAGLVAVGFLMARRRPTNTRNGDRVGLPKEQRAIG